ncbi:MAG: hypothetical protein ACK6AD_09840 [Cyanobacteriota bacterium]|jgi:hypothetical protein
MLKLLLLLNFSAPLTSFAFLFWGEPIFATETKKCKLPSVEYVTVTDGAAALRTDPNTPGQTIPGISDGKKAIIIVGYRLKLLKELKSQMVDDTCYLPVSLSGNTVDTDRVILNHRPYWVPGNAVNPQVKPSLIRSNPNQGNQDSNVIAFDQYIFWCLTVGVLSYIGFNVFNMFKSRRGTSKNWPWSGLGPHPLQLLQWVSMVSPRGTQIFRGTRRIKAQKDKTEGEKNEISTKVDQLLNKLVETNQPLNKLDEISQSLNKLAETNQSANHGKPKGDQKSQQSDLQSRDLKTNADAIEQLLISVEQLLISVKSSIKDPDKNPDDSESAPVRVRPESDQQNRPLGTGENLPGDQPEAKQSQFFDNDQSETSAQMSSDADDQFSRSNVIKNFNDKDKKWFQKNIDANLFMEVGVTVQSSKGLMEDGKRVIQLENRKSGPLLIYKQENKLWLVPNIIDDKWYLYATYCFEGNDDDKLVDLAEVMQRSDKWQVVSKGKFKN